MCGHVGVVGDLTAKEEKIIKELLVVDSLRGVDSTGVAVVGKNNDDVKLAKHLGHPFELMESAGFRKALSAQCQRGIIGHNRYGTVGKVSRVNAHPFEFDTLVGAHNGTLKSKWKIPDQQYFDTDSEALYNHMDSKGLKDLMTYMDGAWALVWWDKMEQSINFLRNKERTLYLTYTEDAKQLYWASEAWMLTGVLGRNGVKIKEPFMLGEDVHLSIVVNKNGSMDKPHATNMPSKYTAPVVQTYNRYLGNVTPINESKKEGVAPVTAANSQAASSTSGFGGSKQVKLTVTTLVENDGYGSAYLTCKSSERPYANVRWYFGRGIEPEDMIDELIVGDISEAVIRGNDPMYFKVIASTVTMADDPVGAAEEETVEETYEDHRGRHLSFNDWMHKHGDCTFCTQSILPTDRHAFNAAGQIFCETCMEDDGVKQYTSFTKLVEKTSFVN